MRTGTELGKSMPLPDGWRWEMLRDLCKMPGQYGASTRSNLNSKGIPILGMYHIHEGRIRWENVSHVDLPEEQLSKYRLNDGDLLFNRTNSAELVGKTAVYDQDTKAVFASYLIRFRLKEDTADPNFVCAFINSKGGRAFIERHMSRAIGQVNISASTMHKMPIALPELPEQQRISAVLHQRSAIIRKAREAAQTSLEASLKLPAAYVRESLATGSKKKYKLGECLDEVKNGVGLHWSRYPIYGATRDGIAPAKEGVGKAPERYKLVDPVTVFYNPMRILLGSIAMVDGAFPPGITSPDYVVLKGKPGILDTRWFYHWFRSAQGAHLINSLSRGAVRERILFNRLAVGEIELPSYETQLRASERMKLISPLVASIIKELEAIDSLPAALLRRAFNGEI